MAWTPANAQEAVEALYIGYFGRAGEPGGVSYWINQINAAPNIQTGFALAAAAFSVQQEAKNEYAFLAAPNLASPVAFITALYNNLLERAPDAEGLAYWTGQATAAQGNPFAIGLLVAQFISGATNSAAGQDIDTIQNKVDAAEFFTQALADANISGTDGNGQVLPDVQAAGKSIIGAVTSDDATVTAANAASTQFAAGGGTGEGVLINVIAGSIVATNAADPAFRSTEAADTVNGTVGAGSSISTAGGNDIVDVAVAADGAEFDLGAGNDSLELNFVATPYEVEADGGDGENTATIVTTGGIAFGTDITLTNFQNVVIDTDTGVSFNTTDWSDVTNISVVDGPATFTEVVGTSEFSISGDGYVIVDYAAGEVAEEISITVEENTNGGFQFLDASGTETLNVAVEGNSTGQLWYSYANNTVVTGEGEVAGAVYLLSTDADGVSFDSSALEGDTALNFSFVPFATDATITLGDDRDFATVNLSGDFNATIDLGGGADALTVTDLSNVTLDAGDVDTWAQLVGAEADETITFTQGVLTEEIIAPAALVGLADIDAALAVVAAGTDAANDFTVFEFQGSTYVYIASTAGGVVTAGDGLFEMVDIVGASYTLSGAGDLTVTV